MRNVAIALAAVVTLAGCANEPRYRQATGADYYYGEDAYSTGYVPDYIAYDAYYGALWPIYHSWYDPFFAPHFYYGVSWYPTNFFGFGGGFGGPYWGYSPWYGSWWDGYYDWRYWDRQHAQQVHQQRFGSVRNEAAAIAQLRRSDGPLNASRGAFAPALSGSAGARQRVDAGASSGAASARTRAELGSESALPTRARNRADIRGQLPTRGVERDTPDPYYGLPRRSRRADTWTADAADSERSRGPMAERRDQFGSPARSASAPMNQDGRVRSRSPAIANAAERERRDATPNFRNVSPPLSSPRSAPTVTAPAPARSRGDDNNDRR